MFEDWQIQRGCQIKDIPRNGHIWDNGMSVTTHDLSVPKVSSHSSRLVVSGQDSMGYDLCKSRCELVVGLRTPCGDGLG